MAGYSDILLEEDGPVALVTLNRPDKLNSMGGSMTKDLAHYLGTLNSGEYRIRAVVLTGAGRAFCAGGDVTAFPNVNEARRAELWRRPPRDTMVLGMRDCDVPVIGAINGYAIGAGFGLALATDFRICSEEVVFQATQIKRGITVDGGLPFLLQAVGTQRALEIIATVRRVYAAEALALGMGSKSCRRKSWSSARWRSPVRSRRTHRSASPPRSGWCTWLTKMTCAQRMVSAWDSGMTGINVGMISNAASPFGDIKQPGIGREGGPEGHPDVMYAMFVNPTLALGR